MSWATLVEESSVPDDGESSCTERFESEEAILHGLRSSYNATMGEVGSNPVGSTAWARAMHQLENLYEDCWTYAERIPSAVNQLQEISFLALRNRAEGLSKDPDCDQTSVYPLILKTVSIMIELGKEDISLVLLAARFAKQMNDMWTYKQLVLFHQTSFPYVYKDLILADFAASVNKNLSDVACIEVDASAAEALTSREQGPLPASARLTEGATDKFVSFVAQKVALGQEFSRRTAWSGFDLGWLDCSVQSPSAEMCEAAPDAITESAAGGAEEAEEEEEEEESGVCARAERREFSCDGDKDDESALPAAEVEMEVEDGADGNGGVGVASSAVAVDLLDADGSGKSRRSGRATKKTDPGAWEEDRALRAALEASKAVSRVPSLSQLSRGTSGSEEASNVADMKVNFTC